MKNNFLFSKSKLLITTLLYQKDYFLSKISKPLFLKKCDYEPLFLNNCKKQLDKDLYYYFDEVQELGPFEDYEEIYEILEKIKNHVNNDPGNEIIDKQVKNVTKVSFFNHSKK